MGSFRANLNEHKPEPMAFVPYGQARDYWASMNLHVRVAPIADEAAVMRAVPCDMVQPIWPWPVLNHRLRCLLRPSTGRLSGVIGRRPAHISAR